MKHPYFNKAVMSAFDRLIMPGEQVPYFIYFNVNPEDIDVNIHPTKTEIKFENEQPIWQILSAAVKDAVGKFNDVPSIDFDTEGRPDIPVFDPHNSAPQPKVQYNPQYNPFTSTPSAHQPKNSVPDDWDQLYEGLKQPQDEPEGMFDLPQEEAKESVVEEKSPTHYQYKGAYIMTAVKSGLMIIDQHRAHMRILYERYLAQMAEHSAPSQKTLFPEVVQLPVSDSVRLKAVLPEMAAIGFELTDLGGGSYSVNATPAGTEGLNVVKLVEEMVASALEKGAGVTDEINKSLALTLARNAAIPQGQVLTNQEMEGIVDNLFSCQNVNYSPDGKPILCILKQEEIEHLLG